MIALLAVLVTLAAPTGFTENATLNARASVIAGKPVTVYCASTDVAWLAAVPRSDGALPDPGGFVLATGDSVAYLSPATCAPILTRLSRRTPNLRVLGGSLELLAHESIHMRGTADEGETECAAFRAFPAYLTSWGFRKNTLAWRQVMYGVTTSHRQQPPAYRTVC